MPLPAPAPQQAPSLPSPAAPVQVAPPPSPPRPPLPDAGGAEACDCQADVEVPIYEQGAHCALATRAARDGPRPPNVVPSEELAAVASL
jgi:hypothetical protein